MQVDWKAYDEVQWQVQAVARTLGLDTGFVSQAVMEWDSYFGDVSSLGSTRALAAQHAASILSVPGKLRKGLGNIRRAIRQVSQGELPKPALKPPSDTPTMDVLGEASGWLRERGYGFLSLETGGDDYLAVPLRQGLLVQAQAAAVRLNMSTRLL